jgi:hypothetical protein
LPENLRQKFHAAKHKTGASSPVIMCQGKYRLFTENFQTSLQNTFGIYRENQPWHDLCFYVF